jgi:hypothetical protein
MICDFRAVENQQTIGKEPAAKGDRRRSVLVLDCYEFVTKGREILRASRLLVSGLNDASGGF